jgi:hypothetical protein
MAWPRTLSDLAQLGRDLHGYSQSGPWPLAHVIAVMAISAVWKHAWSIPGSVLWVSSPCSWYRSHCLIPNHQNVLAGALFSPAFATIMLTALTTIGSLCATLLAAPLAPFLSYLFPRALEMTRNALAGNSSEPNKDDDSSTKSAPWVRLSILRLIGVVPWSGINIACGVCGVSFTDCMLGTFIGCLPWTAVTCQVCSCPLHLNSLASDVETRRLAIYFRRWHQLLPQHHRPCRLYSRAPKFCSSSSSYRSCPWLLSSGVITFGR